MYYRQPRYFKDFRCVGGECLDNCCFGWRIDWRKDEVERLKSAEMSAELRGLVESAFTENGAMEGQFRIKLDDRASCPFQTEDKLCRIQRELGAEYLSSVCTTYPRHENKSREAIYRHCYTSCPVIIDALLNNENASDLVNVNIEGDRGKKVDVRFDETERRYKGELLDFYYELISDKRISVETALILGALAAQKLTEIVARKELGRIPEALKAFRRQFHNAEQLKAIESIKPNYHLKFAFLAELIEKVIENGATVLLRDETGTLNVDLYNLGERRLREMLGKREHFLRNLALNLLLEFAVPFRFKDKTIFENYSLYVAAFGCLKLNLIAVCSTDRAINFNTYAQTFRYVGDDKLIGMSAIFCRGVCQADDKAEAIIKRLSENKFTSPAYLALLVK
ncbi:MAG: flagellin lysine-N-methylase [Oscillospiraceae bacterium]|nr:flagellin lysine-N-methylase [Oscillospiraceae bacterium]